MDDFSIVQSSTPFANAAPAPAPFASNAENIQSASVTAGSLRLQSEASAAATTIETATNSVPRPSSAGPTTATNLAATTLTLQNVCCNIDRAVYAWRTAPQVHHTLESSLALDGNAAFEATLFIRIIDAVKTADSSGQFVAYTLQRQTGGTVRRRYSDFESLRKILVSTWPAIVMPPIPEKHSLGIERHNEIFDLNLADYAQIQHRARDEAALVEKRKRMLQSFLNRVAEHPILSRAHIFHRFVDEDKTWSELIAQEGKVDKPALVSSSKIKHPDAKFQELETENNYYGHSLASIEKSHKRVMKRYDDISSDYSDLGAALNAFSLEEKSLSKELEMLGGSVDRAHVATNAFITFNEEIFGETVQEFAYYSTSIKHVLKHRLAKQLALEEVVETLQSKRTHLLQLESQASGSQSALNRGVVSPTSPTGVLGNLTGAVHQMLDASPETTRRNGIARTRDQIAQLEAQQVQLTAQLETLSRDVERELAYFAQVRRRDLKRIMLRYAREQVKYYTKNVNTWDACLNDLEAKVA